MEAACALNLRTVASTSCMILITGLAFLLSRHLQQQEPLLKTDTNYHGNGPEYSLVDEVVVGGNEVVQAVHLRGGVGWLD